MLIRHSSRLAAEHHLWALTRCARSDRTGLVTMLAQPAVRSYELRAQASSDAPPAGDNPRPTRPVIGHFETQTLMVVVRVGELPRCRLSVLHDDAPTHGFGLRGLPPARPTCSPPDVRRQRTTAIFADPTGRGPRYRMREHRNKPERLRSHAIESTIRPSAWSCDLLREGPSSSATRPVTQMDRGGAMTDVQMPSACSLQLAGC